MSKLPTPQSFGGHRGHTQPHSTEGRKRIILPWALFFRNRILKHYSTLNVALVDTADQTWSDFMIAAPNGVKMSIEVARMI